jgi:pre-mRNA-processing factor 19
MNLGNVFEKRLIEAYISENGKDPVTGEDLSVDELVELKSSRTVRPRPPTLTSIPSLLSVFQNEWDALALETYTLRQHLTQTKQELTRALYEHDAAVRVITRLSNERDEARDALSKITLNGGGAKNGDAMQVDVQELPEELVARVRATQEKYDLNLSFYLLLDCPHLLTLLRRLSKTRRKRAVPEEWATHDTISSFAPLHKSKPFYTGARTVSLNDSGDLALFGGSDGSAGVFSISQNKLVQELAVGSPIADTIWAGSRAIIGTSTGIVKAFENGVEISSFSGHAGEVTALALHPSGDILASVGVDRSYIFYDLTSYTQALQISTDSCKTTHPARADLHAAANQSVALTTAQFHPDGHLFAAGGVDGQIKVFEVTSGANAANFDETGPIQALSFSENGIWLAVVAKASSIVSIWDLRKSAQLKVLETGGLVACIRWDYTGQFLATAGPSGITVQQYSKSAKEWSEPLRSAEPAVAVDWGSLAQNLVTLNEGKLTILGIK